MSALHDCAFLRKDAKKARAKGTKNSLYFESECAIILPEAPECRRSEIKLNKETSGAVFSAKDRSRETGKREAGESPARSRHCKQGVRAKVPLGNREGGKDNDL